MAGNAESAKKITRQSQDMFVIFSLRPYYFFFLRGTFLVVQWLRLHTPKAGDPGSIPGNGTRFHVPQLRSGAAK